MKDRFDFKKVLRENRKQKPSGLLLEGKKGLADLSEISLGLAQKAARRAYPTNSDTDTEIRRRQKSTFLDYVPNDIMDFAKSKGFDIVSAGVGGYRIFTSEHNFLVHIIPGMKDIEDERSIRNLPEPQLRALKVLINKLKQSLQTNKVNEI